MVVKWDMNDNWTFKSITAYRETFSENNIDFDTTPAPIADVYAIYEDDQTSQEFQFLYDGGGDFAGVFGAYYFDGLAGGLVESNFFNATFATTEGATQTDSIAIFGDGSYALTDQWTFNFGLRYTEEDKNGRAFNALHADDSFDNIVLVSADYDETETFSSVSPKLGLDYRFNDNVMGYVTLSRGFKSGGYNVRAQSSFFPESALPFQDEELTVAEVGVKSVLAEGSLVLNAAAFYGDYTDIQVSTFTSYDSDIPPDGIDDSFFGNFINAGDATMSGLELEMDWKSRSADWFGMTGNLSWLDADPDEFLDENGDTFVDTQVITNAPELTGAINFNFYRRVWGGLLTGSVGYAYRDDSVLTNEGGEDPLNPGQPLLPLVQESFSMVNARVGWMSKDGTWGVMVNGKNLTDEEYLTNGYNIPVLGVFQGSYGQPLTVTATLEYNFF
jgi:iron complex outermembrane receptor protein